MVSECVAVANAVPPLDAAAVTVAEPSRFALAFQVLLTVAPGATLPTETVPPGLRSLNRSLGLTANVSWTSTIVALPVLVSVSE